jgi:hypothetical protein
MSSGAGSDVLSDGTSDAQALARSRWAKIVNDEQLGAAMSAAISTSFRRFPFEQARTRRDGSSWNRSMSPSRYAVSTRL